MLVEVQGWQTISGSHCSLRSPVVSVSEGVALRSHHCAGPIKPSVFALGL